MVSGGSTASISRRRRANSEVLVAAARCQQVSFGDVPADLYYAGMANRVNPPRARRALLVVGVPVLVAFLTTACLDLPGGGCDEYDQGHRPSRSSCTSDGKVETKTLVGCSGDGRTYSTSTTACDAGEVCVADGVSAACLRPCATSAECPVSLRRCELGHCQQSL